MNDKGDAAARRPPVKEVARPLFPLMNFHPIFGRVFRCKNIARKYARYTVFDLQDCWYRDPFSQFRKLPLASRSTNMFNCIVTVNTAGALAPLLFLYYFPSFK